MVANEFDFEPAGELKFGQVGIANLKVIRLDAARLAAEMRERVLRAPKMFEHAAVVVDFGGLSQCPDVDTARSLIAGLRDAGVLPVALSYGTRDIEHLARALQLPLLAKFRAQYEPAPTDSAPARAEPRPPEQPEPPRPPEPQVPEQSIGSDAIGQVHAQPVRSGQQVYARGRDLVLTAAVGAGAEVIADGSVHIYAALRGRALAGARGNTGARIFCREFAAELVAIAGRYKVLEDIPPAIRGKAVQIWLDGETIRIEEQQ